MSHYHGYRGRTRIVAPPSVALSATALALVVGALAVDWTSAACLAVLAYVVLGGRAGGRAPTWHVFAVASALFMLGVVASMYRGQGPEAMVFGGLALLTFLFAVAVRRLASPPSTFTPFVHLRVDGGEAGCGEPAPRAMTPQAYLVTCPACFRLTQARTGDR